MFCTSSLWTLSETFKADLSELHSTCPEEHFCVETFLKSLYTHNFFRIFLELRWKVKIPSTKKSQTLVVRLQGSLL